MALRGNLISDNHVHNEEKLERKVNKVLLLAHQSHVKKLERSIISQDLVRPRLGLQVSKLFHDRRRHFGIFMPQLNIGITTQLLKFQLSQYR